MATVKDPNQLTAWQGLAAMYEKSTQFQQDLPQVYEKLANLCIESNPDKFWEIKNKLWALKLKLGDWQDAVEVLKGQVEHYEGKDVFKQRESRGNIIKILNEHQEQCDQMHTQYGKE